ncbi:branched-chain amino acid aminotransferase [bacterium]|nr:branched-chain amino acid aminotransferase [bacterium]
MTTLMTQLLNDENGFIVSAELVLITTIAVLGLVVGLTEVSYAVNNELEDVASAIGAMNQSFQTSGLKSCMKSSTSGSRFSDSADLCDSQWDIQAAGTQAEN